MRVCDALFTSLFFISCYCSSRNYYEILGVPRDATPKQIKLKYLEKARKLHPDVNKSPDAEIQFQELGNAYSTLSKPAERKIYDKYGEEGLTKHRQNGDDGNDFGDPFSSFFGSFFNNNQKNEIVRGNDIRIPFKVSLEEMYEGTFIEFVRNKPVYVNAPGKRKCNCRTEMGTTRQGHSIYLTQVQVCDDCPNKILKLGEDLIEIEVENGSQEGTQIIIPGQGEPHIDAEHGDLIIILQQISHSIFERGGNDLYTNVSISLIDSLLGFTTSLTHLDLHTVVIDRSGNMTAHGSVLRIAKEGMPIYQRYGSFGDLYVSFNVIFPHRTFSDSEQIALREMFGNTDTTDLGFFNGQRTNYPIIYL